MFQALSQGSNLFILYKNEPRMEKARVVSVNTHLPQFNPSQPQAMFNGMVTDLTVAIGSDETATATLPLVELGGIEASFTQTDNTAVNALLYDNEGRLLDVYPFPDYTFHVTTGFYLGTDEVVKLENTIPVKDFDEGEGIVIGDHIVGFDSDGYAHGSIKVNKFRPYVGIGFGRSVPRRRFGVSGDFGVQFWGKPKVYEKQTGMDLEVKKEDLGDDSNKYYDVISKFAVWPVLNFRLTYRIF